MTGPTKLCPRCRGLNPDCGTCLGLGEVPAIDDDGDDRAGRFDPERLDAVDRLAHEDALQDARKIVDRLARRLSPEDATDELEPRERTASRIFRHWLDQMPAGLLPRILICFDNRDSFQPPTTLTTGDPTRESVVQVLRDVADHLESDQGLPSQAVPDRTRSFSDEESR